MKKILLLLFLLPLFTQAQIITTIAGCGIGDDSVATNSELFSPYGVAIDKNGNVYIAETRGNRIRKVDSSGIITTLAGIAGNGGYSGDGGPATAAQLDYPSGVAVDRAGNVYVSDQENYRVRKIDTLGIIITIAGTGDTAFGGDGGPATAAGLTPVGLAFDTTGNLYIADAGHNRIRKIDTSGIITTVAGNGAVIGAAGFYGDGGAATAANLYEPFDVAMDRFGNLYIADFSHQLVREVNTSGTISTIAGTGAYGYFGDGGPAIDAELRYPNWITTDTFGNVYITDEHNFRIREIDTAGIITTIAGKGVAGDGGDGEPADSAEFDDPEAIVFDGTGNLYIADAWNNRVRKVNAAGTMSTFAGQNGLFNDGITATHAEINAPNYVAVDTAGNVYVADYPNNRIQKISVSGIITTVAGNGVSGTFSSFSGDGGPADSAQILWPAAVAVDAAGNLYIADYLNQRIRKVNTLGVITTIAGNSTPGFTGDGGPASAAEISSPDGIAVDAAGNVYIADLGNYRIRQINTSGIINTVAGNGSSAYSGDGIPADSAAIDPYDVAVDATGNLYIADGYNYRIRKVGTNGIISTVAGNGVEGFSGDGALAASAEIGISGGLKADAAGNVYFADNSNNRIRMVNEAGIINTVAGNGIAGFYGDGGIATIAELNGPTDVAVDGSGNMYIADGYNYRIRKVNLSYLSVPAINKTNSGNIVIYPNPASTQLTILSTNQPINQIAISNLLGQTMHSNQYNASQVQVDVTAFAPGIYFVKVNGVEVRKFVKE